MANVISPELKANYLVELQGDENNINDAAEAYMAAKARLDVTLRRYVALRDFIAEQLGISPYDRSVGWPDDAVSNRHDGWEPIRGRYRFSGLKPADAIREVLRERASAPGSGWMTLAAIINALAEGGLGFPETVEARAVNAALLQAKEVERGARQSSGEKLYRFIEEERSESGGWAGDDPDDLPFE